MAILRAEKVVSTLPGSLEADTIYAVRVGDGFDFYISDSTGSTAHLINPRHRIGDVKTSFAPIVPAGWLELDGSTFVVASYPSLASHLYCGDSDNASAEWGYRCNNSNGTTRSTTGTYLVLPDVRDRYVRGWTSGSIYGFWNYYVDEIKAHSHTYADYYPVTTANRAAGGAVAATSLAEVARNTGSTGGLETRPRTILAKLIIFGGP